MPRFVVLEHVRTEGTHWDLMLESGDALATWALAVPPDTRQPIAAEQLPDHRLAYLDYEGPISGGRGDVSRWDHGACEFQRSEPGTVLVWFHGQRLRGAARLLQSDAAMPWTFTMVG
jgi:hypothetical protein